MITWKQAGYYCATILAMATILIFTLTGCSGPNGSRMNTYESNAMCQATKEKNLCR